jgi:hypothetical protein
MLNGVSPNETKIISDAGETLYSVTTTHSKTAHTTDTSIRKGSLDDEELIAVLHWRNILSDKLEGVKEEQPQIEYCKFLRSLK